MTIFENCPENIQTFIKENCPYEIGDKVLYEVTYFNRLDSTKFTYNGVVKDIYPHFMRELIPHFEQSDLYEVKINEEAANKPMPKFTLFIECQVPNKKPWHKFLEKNTYHTEEKNITIDIFNCVDNPYPYVFKQISKI